MREEEEEEEEQQQQQQKQQQEEEEERRTAGVEERVSVPLTKVVMSKMSLRDSGICRELCGWWMWEEGAIQRGRR